AAVAPSSRVATRRTPAGVAPSYPSRQAITGFRVSTAAWSTASATAGEDGLETIKRTSVPGSAPRAATPWSVVSPPTAAWRSPPPVPTAEEIPPPRRRVRDGGPAVPVH